VQLVKTLGKRGLAISKWLLVLCFVPISSWAAIGPPPLIAVQPLDQTVLKGNNATFSVSAVSGTTMTYQWKQNGSTISGATQSSFTLKAMANALFSVDIINASGMVTSSNAALNVIKKPNANNDSYSVLQDHTLLVAAPGVLANDSDSNGLLLTAALATLPAHGTLVLNVDGSFSYIPASGFYGTDSFAYRATDPLVGSDTATVTIQVLQIIDAPLALTAIGMAANGFQLQLTGPAPANYIILASSNLQNWTPIATNFVVGGLLHFTDTNASILPKRFYQAVAQKTW
jgi:hypothetical protein